MYVKPIFCFRLVHRPIGILYIPTVYIGWTDICRKRKLQGRKIPETRVLMTIVAPPLEMMTPKNDRREPGRCIAVMRYWGRRKKWIGVCGTRLK